MKSIRVGSGEGWQWSLKELKGDLKLKWRWWFLVVFWQWNTSRKSITASRLLGGHLERHTERGHDYTLSPDFLPALHALAVVQEPCWVGEKAIPPDQYLWLYYLSASAGAGRSRDWCRDRDQTAMRGLLHFSGKLRWIICSFDISDDLDAAVSTISLEFNTFKLIRL